MNFSQKLKLLRKEKGWPQDELSEKIVIDGRQISRYENNKITPSTECIVKIAEVFNVSIDYLLLEDAPRTPIKFKDEKLIEKFKLIDNMSEEDKLSLIHIIDAIEAKNKFKNLAGQIK